MAGRLRPREVDRVLDVRFERSPVRWDPAFLDTGSAFDLFLVYLTASGERGFVAIEVKYHENIRDVPPQKLRLRHRGCV